MIGCASGAPADAFLVHEGSPARSSSAVNAWRACVRR